MADKKYMTFSQMRVVGVVQDFKIMKFNSGTKMANITIKNKNGRTYVKMFDKKEFQYNGKKFSTMEGFSKVFLDSNGNSKGELVEVSGRASESVVNKDGEKKVYANNLAFKIDSFDDIDRQCSTMSLTGIVESVKTNIDEGEEIAKIKLGFINVNSDQELTGVD